jgi:hypothetical protein
MAKKRVTAVVRQVRFPPGQYAVVAARARALGMPVSSFVRLAALSASGSRIARDDRLFIDRLLAP